MTPEELQELSALYVLGALEAEAAAELEARLQAGDTEIMHAIQAFQQVADLLPYALPPIPPRPTVRTRLMARVQAPHSDPLP
jgi:anti-sigma-K factor RskA